MISGNKAAVERAADLAKARGAKRAVMLPVSAPFHCALMQPAQQRLAADLKAVRLSATLSRTELVNNVDAAMVSDPELHRDALVRQVTGAVQWLRCMQSLIAQKVSLYIEVGPGKVLCGLMRQIDRSQSYTNVEDEASLQKTLEFLTQAPVA